jgi:hypothetical protein
MSTPWKRFGNLLYADPEPKYHLMVWLEENAAQTHGWLLLDSDGRTLGSGSGIPTEETARRYAALAYIEHSMAHETKEATH